MANGLFGGGNGTELTPYLIEDLLDLDAVRNDLTTYYELINNIDASDTVNWNSGAGFIPIGNFTTKFSGSFDGKGYRVTGLYVKRSVDNNGLFGYVSSSGVVKNLGMVDGRIEAIGSTLFNHGAIVGNNYGAIQKCFAVGGYVKALNSGYNAGGIAGSNSGTITDCFAGVAVNCPNKGAGLIGGHSTGTISNCYSIGVVTGLAANYCGGLIGYTYSGSVINCFWDTETSGQTTSGGGTGKTTAQMKQQATFANWDFNSIWSINEGVSYPALLVFATGVMQTINADMLRQTVVTESVLIDMLRQTVVTESVFSDTLRRIIEGIEQTANIDTLRQIIRSELVSVSTKRTILVNETILADTLRNVYDDTYDISLIEITLDCTVVKEFVSILSVSKSISLDANVADEISFNMEVG